MPEKGNPSDLPIGSSDTSSSSAIPLTLDQSEATPPKSPTALSGEAGSEEDSPDPAIPTAGTDGAREGQDALPHDAVTADGSSSAIESENAPSGGGKGGASNGGSRGQFDGGANPAGDTMIVAVCIISLGFIIFQLWSGSDQSDLRIIPTRIEGFHGTDANATTEQGTVSGIVTHNEVPFPAASVFVVATDGFGNKVGAFAPATKADGTFEVKIGPLTSATAGDRTFSDLQVTARKTETGYFRDHQMEGTLTVKLKRGGIIQDFRPQLRNLVLTLFATSLALAIFTPSQLWAARLQHFASIFVTCVLSASVVVAFGYGMSLVDNLPERDAARLGFATIFRGSYVADLPDEWLVSLTSPPDRFRKDTAVIVPKSPNPQNAADAPKLDDPITTRKPSETFSGVGAPLWFLFVGTIGAMLLTFDLVVTEIGAPASFGPDGNSRRELRLRLQRYVQHSFFVLFSPFVGLFVYQVVAGTRICSAPILVGIIALGTGPILPILLERGVRQAVQLFQRETTSEQNSDAKGKTNDG
jgi:hypothetical protein